MGKRTERPMGFFVLTAWLATLCQGRPREVVSLYMPNAVLVPTFAEIRIGREEILDYFQVFMSRTGLCGQIDNWVEQPIDPRPIIWDVPVASVVSGVYTFGWHSPDGGQEAAKARFSMVVARAADGYKIINHHSSALPPTYH